MVKPEILGERIRAARKAAGLTQAQLAVLVEVSQPTVCGWESGESPSYQHIVAVAQACGISLVVLLGDGPISDEPRADAPGDPPRARVANG